MTNIEKWIDDAYGGLLDKQDRQIEFYEDEIESLKDQIEDLAEALMSVMEEIEEQNKLLEWALEELYKGRGVHDVEELYQ